MSVASAGPLQQWPGMRSTPSPGPLAERAGDRRFAVRRLRVDGAHVLQFRPRSLMVAVAWGPCRWSTASARGAFADGPALFERGSAVTLTAEHAEIVALTLAPRPLLRQARRIYADRGLQVRFDGPHPVSPESGGRFAALLDAVASGSGVLELLDVREAFYRTLALAVLESFRLEGDARARRAAAARLLVAYRSGSRFIDAHAGLPISTPDTAQAAGVSARVLLDAFRAHDPLGRTPARYLKAQRVGGAR